LGLLESFGSRGAEVSAAIRNTANNAGLLHDAGIPAFQAPVSVFLPSQGEHDVLSYLDVLRVAGIADVNILIGLLHAWRSLLEVTHATAVIAHHAPTAMLAAKTLGLPAQRLGAGFACPTPDSISKNFLPWVKADPAVSREQESATLDSINTALSHFGAAPVASIGAGLSSTLDNGCDWLLTYPELDHCLSTRVVGEARYMGNTEKRFTAQEKAELSTIAGFDGVFAYVHPEYPEIQSLVEGMKRVARSGVPVAVFAARLADQVRKEWLKNAPPHFSVLPSQVSLPEMMRSARLLVSHCNHGVLGEALRAGVPCLSFPRTAEQWQLGAAVEKMGAGKSHVGKLNPSSAMQLINEVASNPTYRQSARSFADRYDVQGKQNSNSLVTSDDLWQILVKAA
jgi:hypothetical protein